MPQINRTPPPNTPKQRTEVLSEPELTGCDDGKTKNVNTRKRMRLERTSGVSTQSKEPSYDVSQFEELKSTILSWKADQDIILKKLVADVTELKLQNQSIKDSNAEIVKSMNFISNNYEDTKKKLDELEREKKSLHECILGLENKIKDIQFMSRTSSIEIKNVPANDKETQSDLMAVVKGLSAAVNVKIESNDLRDVYRIPGKKGANRGIVAEFATVSMKTRLLAGVKSYNKNQNSENKLNTEMIAIPGKRQPVYVAEFLPPSTRQTFYAARNFAKNNKYDFCWVANGNVLIRKEVGAKHIHIQSEKCLLKLKPGL